VKRSPVLQPLSYEHHEGLGFAARLRKGLRAGEDAAEWAGRVGAFWEAHLVPHFAEEESLVVPLLREGAPLLADRLLAEHAALEALAGSLHAVPEAGRLGVFADALVAHIRFEEREAFPAAEHILDGHPDSDD
jgi:hypothetical protein